MTDEPWSNVAGSAAPAPDLAVRKVKSAVRTVELLEYLAARHDSPARLREISDALGMPRSSAHALLRTLVAQGWVRSDASGTLYGITRESKQYKRMSNRVGRRLPAYATALGKALLAERFGIERDEHIPAALKALTPETIVDRAALDDALDDVRVRGYATDDQENTPGLRCFAVALRYCSPAQDAISASVPVERLNPQREREIVDALRAMGDKVSRVVRPLANGDKWFAS